MVEADAVAGVWDMALERPDLEVEDDDDDESFEEDEDDDEDDEDDDDEDGEEEEVWQVRPSTPLLDFVRLTCLHWPRSSSAQR